MSFARSLPVVVLLVAALAPTGRASGGDGTEIVQFLASTGADADATCRVRLKQGDDTSFDVELEHLPAGAYELWVDGVAVHDGTIDVDALGHGELEYDAPQDGGKPLLDFVVLDKLIEIKQAATVFFSDTFSSQGDGGSAGGDDKTKAEVLLVNVGPDPDAHGHLAFQSKSGELGFEIEVEDLQAGTYDLLVAGVPVSQFDVAGEETEVEFQDPVEPGKLLLNFDPLGQQVDIASGGTTFLTAILPASNTTTGTKAPSSGKKGAKDVGKKKGDKLQVTLMNSGVLPGAKGKATLGQDGEVEFEVEIESVPDGSYPLLVGGLQVGTLQAAGGKASLHYSSSPEPGQPLLDFVVKGKVVSVTNGSDAILSVVFPMTAQAALDKFKPEVHDAAHIKVNLVSTGVDLDATGLLDWKHKSSHDTLVISVSDLAPGTYDLLVNGAPIDDAIVIKKQDGNAKLTFDTKPSGKKLLLNFTVPGTSFQVTPSDDNLLVLLSAVAQ
jgi:hypothetical protein